MRQPRHLAKYWVFRGNVTGFRTALWLSEHSTRESVGKGRLANPFGPDEQPGVVQPPTA
jgi:hypothetical protein